MKRALLVIDIQKDYFPGGKNELEGPEQAARQAKKLIDHFHQNREPVIHIQHISTEADAGFFLLGSEGAEIWPGVFPEEGDAVFIKHQPDSFTAEGLEAYLTEGGIGQLVVCGMMSHMCIDTTVRSAAVKGYEVTLAEDACATMALNWHGREYAAQTVHEVFMASVEGVFASVVTAENLLS